MNIIDIIEKKRLNQPLTYDELAFSFLGYLNNQIKDYQMASLLMAITINSLGDNEAMDLTDIFIKSGNTLTFNDPTLVVDKHSTGGVGDKVTLIIGPIIAACGLKFPKMSGRSLGYTGGTIDKLESIPGYQVNLTKDQIYNQIDNIGISISSQTNDLVPLDKVIYELRSSIGAVSSIPLIAISIMSKKIACGAKTVLIDIKYGCGALLKNNAEAISLERLMKLIAKKYQLNLITIINDMNQPLGSNIGNALEVVEALEILDGKQGPLTNLCVDISAKMIEATKNISYDLAKQQAIDVLNNKGAKNKFLELIKAQNGRIDELKPSNNIIEVKSIKSGVLSDINALSIGKLVFNMGAGRLNKEDIIDYSVGLVLIKKINDYININDVLCYLYVNDDNIKYSVDDIFIIKGENNGINSNI